MYENLTAIILNEGYRLGLSIIALIVIYFIYKASLRFLKKQATKLDLEPHIVNALRLVIRVFTLVVSIIAIFTFFDIPSDLFVGTSALLGRSAGLWVKPDDKQHSRRILCTGESAFQGEGLCEDRGP